MHRKLQGNQKQCLNVSPFVQRFVEPVLTHYYEIDADVQEDHGLQNWIKEIFEHGFLSNNNSGDDNVNVEYYHEIVLIEFMC